GGGGGDGAGARRGGEAHAAGLVGERAADAVDQRRFAGAVGADQPDALALGNRQVDAVERDEAAEPLAQTADLEKRARRHFFLPRVRSCTSPTISVGAMMTKMIRNRPTTRTLTELEIGTVTYCCSEPSRIAPINGPAQLVVPPIIGMAIELTAYSSPNAEEGCRYPM